MPCPAVFPYQLIDELREKQLLMNDNKIAKLTKFQPYNLRNVFVRVILKAPGTFAG
jgi:hypothetical protein